MTLVQWAAPPPPPELYSDISLKAPMTVKKVDTMDDEALVLQHRLKDKASREAIRLATERHTKGVSLLATFRETRTRPKQQLVAAKRDVAMAVAVTETNAKDVEAAELSGRDLEDRRRPRRTNLASPSMTSGSRDTPSFRDDRNAGISLPAHVSGRWTRAFWALPWRISSRTTSLPLLRRRAQTCALPPSSCRNQRDRCGRNAAPSVAARSRCPGLGGSCFGSRHPHGTFA